MSTRLIQVVAFANVGAGATVALPHSINVNGTQKKPDFVAADVSGFTIVVTATQVSVTNTGTDPASVNVWLELKHSIPRELGALPNLSPQPFIAASGGGGGGGGGVATDGGAPGLIVDGGLTIPVAGPFRPWDGQYAFAFDDFMVAPAMTQVILGIPAPSAHTSVTYNGFNVPGGPGGNYFGTAEMQITGGLQNEFITLTQAQTDDPTSIGNGFIGLDLLTADAEVFMGAKVGYESPNENWGSGNDGNFFSMVGFYEFSDLSFFKANNEGMYFYPKTVGPNNTWWFRIEWNGLSQDIDTGINIFTAGNGRRGRSFAVQLIKHVPGGGGEDLTINAYANGALVHTAEAFVGSTRIIDVCALRTTAAGPISQNMYVDWMMLGVKGRYDLPV